MKKIAVLQAEFDSDIMICYTIKNIGKYGSFMRFGETFYEEKRKKYY